MVSDDKSDRGRAAFLNGHAAEDIIAADYIATGHEEAARCWRGGGGEIDLIFRKGGEVVFVEVKRSATLSKAAERLSLAQLRRIFQAASVFLANEPAGDLTPSRVDFAMVDQSGQREIFRNIQLP